MFLGTWVTSMIVMFNIFHQGSMNIMQKFGVKLVNLELKECMKKGCKANMVKDFFKEMPEVIKKLLQIYPHSWKVKSFLFQ